jgi:hypothetical protein
MVGATQSDAGVVPRDAYAVPANNPTKPILLAKNSMAVAGDKKGTKAVVLDEMKTARLFPMTGGNGTMLTTNVDWANFVGDSAIITRGNEGGMPAEDVVGNLKRVTTAGMATTLVGSKDVATLREFSADFKYTIFAKEWNSNRFHSSLYLASTEKAGTPVELANNDRGAIFGDAFTADSKYALYYTEATDDGIARFFSIPVAGGKAKEWGDKRVWLSWNIKGSVVTYNPNFKKGAGNPARYLRCDIVFADVAKDDPPTVTVPQADADYYVNKARTKYIYTYSADPMQVGIYAADVPEL